MVPQIGATMYPSILVDVMKEMAGKPFTLLPGHTLKSACEHGVTLTKYEDGSSVFVEADHVVLALGTKSRKNLISAFEKKLTELFR